MASILGILSLFLAVCGLLHSGGNHLPHHGATQVAESRPSNNHMKEFGSGSSETCQQTQSGLRSKSSPI